MNTTHSIAAVLLVLGGLLALANWASVIRSHFTRRFHSPVPLVAAIMLAAGLWLIPNTRPYAWFSPLLDYGTLAILFASPRLIREAWSTSRINLVCEYAGKAGIKTARLRLFRRGIFTLRLNLHRPPGECGLISTGTIGTWQREGTRLMLCTGQESAGFDVVRDQPTEALRQSTGFATWEASPDLSLASIELVRTEKIAAGLPR